MVANLFPCNMNEERERREGEVLLDIHLSQLLNIEFMAFFKHSFPFYNKCLNNL